MDGRALGRDLDRVAALGEGPEDLLGVVPPRSEVISSFEQPLYRLRLASSGRLPRTIRIVAVEVSENLYQSTVRVGARAGPCARPPVGLTVEAPLQVFEASPAVFV